jgi:urea transport system ATP-binding protein
MPAPLLTVRDVTKTYDGFTAISDLNFTLAEGELRMLVGPKGAGKSTFFDLLTGRSRPDRGRIEFGPGTDLTKLKEYQITHLGISRKFQKPSLFPDFTVWDNLVLSLKGSRSVFATLMYRLSSADRDLLVELLKLTGLLPKQDWTVDQLTHGEKQWLEIGMLLATKPKLLLLDSPAAGMNEEEMQRTGELLLSLAGRHSLIVADYDLTFIRRISAGGRVTFLHHGSVLAEGSLEEIQADPKVREVSLGRGRLGRK